MENGSKQLAFKAIGALDAAANISVRGVLNMLLDNINKDDHRRVIPLGHGNPSVFPSFRTASIAEDAIVDAVRSAKFNCYAPTVGLLPARRSIAEYLSHHLSYQLSPDDVYVTAGCSQAIEVMITVLARPGANILLPRPGFSMYESRAAFSNLEVCHFDLRPERDWEVDLDSVEAVTDDNTVAMDIISPGNPCGNVFTYQHLKKVAETARKLGIFGISDEVYGHLAFGSNPFVPMGEFGSIVPVVTLGSISKRWIVPGWRIGWIATNDPNGILKESGIVESIMSYLNGSTDPATFIQVKLNLSLLEDISDDLEFCLKLAKEESVIVLPGFAVGKKNWLRITFAVELQSLEEGLGRITTFYQRHVKKQ